MEIEEEEVKWEAMEPEKDEPVLTLGLRCQRAPERPLPQISFSQLSSLRLLDLKEFPELRPSWLDLSSIKNMLPELASGNNQTIPEFLMAKLPELRSWNDHSLQELIGNTILMEKLPYLASRNTQRPLPELQANDNRLENLSASVFSQDLLSMNDNDVNQHVIYVEAEQLLDAGESSRPREISGWTLLMTNLILEIASAVFDQMGYAQIGMVLAFVALLLAAVDLIHMARKERIKRAAGMSPLPLFHPRSTYTTATRKPVGTIC
ncbi:hypothetical protein H0E87_003583 [Populus deltoides]|uniref:Uncharacterized protein n=1 Tax=Populus deltoides TaxID=3696 RepID=A0A8T3A435_POPDE|nr:hypothetical protein H0E87_003583 [Populus deltoides]